MLTQNEKNIAIENIYKQIEINRASVASVVSSVEPQFIPLFRNMLSLYTEKNYILALEQGLKLASQTELLSNEFYDVIAECFYHNKYYKYAFDINLYLLELNYNPNLVRLTNAMKYYSLRKQSFQTLQLYFDFFKKNRNFKTDAFTEILVAQSHVSLGEIDKATHILTKIIKQKKLEITKVNTMTHSERQLLIKIFLIQARIMEYKELYDEATEHYNILLSQFLHEDQVYLQAGNFYYRLNRLDLAENIFNTFYTNHANSIRAIMMYALFLAKFPERINEARDICEDFVINKSMYCNTIQIDRLKILLAWFAIDPQEGLQLLYELRDTYSNDATIHELIIYYANIHPNLNVSADLAKDFSQIFRYMDANYINVIKTFHPLRLIMNAINNFSIAKLPKTIVLPSMMRDRLNELCVCRESDCTCLSDQIFFVGGGVIDLLDTIEPREPKDLDAILIYHTKFDAALSQYYVPNIHNNAHYVRNTLQYGIPAMDLIKTTKHSLSLSSFLLSDALARDFTICAIYCDSAGVIYDPTRRGLNDLNSKLLSTIGDAHICLAADPIRVLRLIKYLLKGYTCSHNLQLALDAWSCDDVLSNMHFIDVLMKQLCGSNNIEYVKCLQNNRLISRIFNLHLDDTENATEVCGMLLNTLFANLPNHEQNKWISIAKRKQEEKALRSLEIEQNRTTFLQNQILQKRAELNLYVGAEVVTMMESNKAKELSLMNKMFELGQKKSIINQEITRLRKKRTILSQITAKQQSDLQKLTAEKDYLSAKLATQKVAQDLPLIESDNNSFKIEYDFLAEDLTLLLSFFTIARVRFWLYTKLLQKEEEKRDGASVFIQVNLLKQILKNPELTELEREDYRLKVNVLSNQLHKSSLIKAQDYYNQGKAAYYKKDYEAAIYYAHVACEVYSSNNTKKYYYDAYDLLASSYLAKDDLLNFNKYYVAIKKINTHKFNQLISEYQEILYEKILEDAIKEVNQTGISLKITAIKDCLAYQDTLKRYNKSAKFQQKERHELYNIIFSLKRDSISYVVAALELAYLLPSSDLEQLYMGIMQYDEENTLPGLLSAIFNIEYSEFLKKNPTVNNVMNCHRMFNSANINLGISASTWQSHSDAWVKTLADKELDCLALYSNINRLKIFLLNEYELRHPFGFDHINPQDLTAEQLYQQANSAKQKGDYQVAIYLYHQALNKKDNYINAYVDVIDLYILIEDWYSIQQQYIDLHKSLINVTGNNCNNVLLPLLQKIKAKLAEYIDMKNSINTDTLIYWKLSSCILLLMSLAFYIPDHNELIFPSPQELPNFVRDLYEYFETIIRLSAYGSASYGVANLELAQLLSMYTLHGQQKTPILYLFLEAESCIPSAKKLLDNYDVCVKPLVVKFKQEAWCDEMSAHDLIDCGESLIDNMHYTSALKSFEKAIAKSQNARDLAQSNFAYFMCCCLISKIDLITEEIMTQLINYYDLEINNSIQPIKWNYILSILFFAINNGERLSFPPEKIIQITNIYDKLISNHTDAQEVYGQLNSKVANIC